MIFYPETGPQCPALPAGQACIVGIDQEMSWLKPIFRILSISRPWTLMTQNRQIVSRLRCYFTGAPIFHAAGLNMGKGMVVVSDGLFDSGFSSC